MTTNTHYAIRRMFDEYLVRQRWQEENQLKSNSNLKYKSKWKQ